MVIRYSIIIIFHQNTFCVTQEQLSGTMKNVRRLSILLEKKLFSLRCNLYKSMLESNMILCCHLLTVESKYNVLSVFMDIY